VRRTGVLETIDILREPTGKSYRDLLSFALAHCGSFLLVVRHDLQLSLRGRSVLAELRPSLRREHDSREWPGTVLLRELGTVSEFDFNANTARVLERAAGSLYSWRQPHLPEDLCMLRSNGKPWLVTIAHERDGYLELTASEVHALLGAVPTLAKCLAARAE
jgi:hypothetical protein